MNKIRHWFEKHGFEVSSRFADTLGMKVKNVRLFFIYACIRFMSPWRSATCIDPLDTVMETPQWQTPAEL